jgi:hypothetical protein
MLDIDLWVKDKLDVANFEEWFLAYAHCPNNEVRYEFIQTEQFLLYLKGRFGIHTFDIEDPMYPDHDNYFLTDDNQLLIEYDDDFAYVNELKLLIGELYDVMGVEGAYTYLFKMISDSFLISIEENYQQKVKNLHDYGIVDYFESLEILHPFPSVSHIDIFIKNKTPLSFQASDLSLNESLNGKYLLKVKDPVDKTFEREFELISDNQQYNWIRYNFVRLMNAKMSLDGKLESNSLIIQKTSHELTTYLQLGLEFIRTLFTQEVSVFNYFGFDDIYKIGFSLVAIEKKKVDRSIAQYPKGIENFWGQIINNSLENLLETPVVVGKFSEKGKVVNTLSRLEQLRDDVEKILSLLPVINQFYTTFVDLTTNGTVSDTYYLNYTLEDIEFESVLISTFFNYILGNYKDSDHQKRLGIRVKEFKNVLCELFGSSIFNVEANDLKEKITEFAESYGLSTLKGFNSYFFDILSENLSGYEFEHLSYDDYKHVGGVIFFNEA